MNLMGFRKIDKLPKECHRGIYDNVLETVARTADMYALDTNDVKRAKSLVTTLRSRAKKLGLPVKVILRNTTVCVVRSMPLVIETRDDQIPETSEA